jgi:Bacterial Ig-like domain (group 2)
MNRNWSRLCGFSLIVVGLLTSLSCGHDQQLVSITVQPAQETIGATDIPVSADAGLTVQLRALGSYIHPPVTKDITNQVAWSSNTPGIATVDAAGLLTATGIDCGDALVSATVQTNHSTGNISSSGAVVTGYMTATVVCFTNSGSSEPLTVKFSGAGAGTVTSLPLGLSCASTCSASLGNRGPITLTAKPNGSSFGGWSGCDSVSSSGLVCTVDNAAEARAVTATFN